MQMRIAFLFQAGHFLGQEALHVHDWSLRLCLFGKEQQGKIVDLMGLRSHINAMIEKLQGSSLNGHPFLDQNARQMPTCETLAHWFFDQIQKKTMPLLLEENPSVCLQWVEVGIAEPTEAELGSVRLTHSGEAFAKLKAL